MEEQCPSCGANVPPGERPPHCPACGAGLPAEAQPAIPFDEPRSEGFGRALWQTWRQASLDPNAFFSRIPTSAEWRWPLVYAVLFWWFYALANALIQQPVLRAMTAAAPQRARIPAGFLETSPEMIFSQFAILPFFFVAALVVASAAFHGLLYLVNGAHQDFVATLRSVCYTSGAFVAYLLPGFGPFLHIAWVLLLLIIGLARTHQTEPWRSAFAVLLPSIACLALLVVFALFLAAALLRGLSTG